MTNTCTAHSDKSTVKIASTDRFIFTAIATVLTALLLWVGGTLNNNQLALASLQVEMVNLRVDLAEIVQGSSSLRNRVVTLEKEVSAIRAMQTYKAHE